MNGIELGKKFREKGFFLSDNSSQTPVVSFKSYSDWKKLIQLVLHMVGKPEHLF